MSRQYCLLFTSSGCASLLILLVYGERQYASMARLFTLILIVCSSVSASLSQFSNITPTRNACTRLLRKKLTKTPLQSSVPGGGGVLPRACGQSGQQPPERGGRRDCRAPPEQPPDSGGGREGRGETCRVVICVYVHLFIFCP
jgi:hypothetical protein